MGKKVAFRFGEDKKGILPWLEIYNHFFSKYGNLSGLVFTANFDKLREPKTYNQLQYFHCDDFLLRFSKALAKSGTYGKAPENEDKLKEWGKRQIKLHPDIHLYHEEINAFTGEVEKVIESLADISKDEMSRVIDWCIETAKDYLGVILESSDDYKKRYRLKQ